MRSSTYVYWCWMLLRYSFPHVLPFLTPELIILAARKTSLWAQSDFCCQPQFYSHHAVMKGSRRPLTPCLTLRVTGRDGGDDWGAADPDPAPARRQDQAEDGAALPAAHGRAGRIVRRAQQTPHCWWVVFRWLLAIRELGTSTETFATRWWTPFMFSWCGMHEMLKIKRQICFADTEFIALYWTQYANAFIANAFTERRVICKPKSACNFLTT